MLQCFYNFLKVEVWWKLSGKLLVLKWSTVTLNRRYYEIGPTISVH